MVMELQWSHGQTQPSASKVFIRLYEEEPPHKVIAAESLRLGSLEVGDEVTPKLEIHTHSIEFSEWPYFQVNDKTIWNIPQTAAPNGFRYSRMVAHIRNAGSQVPGDGDALNFSNALWERKTVTWQTYPMSTNASSNSWGDVVWGGSGVMFTEETMC
jgi:hypothetical protein